MTLPLGQTVYQSAINVSEGRRSEVLATLERAVRGVVGALLIDASADSDHNRSVFTLLGDAEGIRAAALALAQVAIAQIDLREHRGIHPRTGAVDVLPVVPLRGADRASAVAVAHAIGQDLAIQCNLPVYFYEWVALPQRPTSLPELRKRHRRQEPLLPDLGPATPHPTAGVVHVGAREALIAYNINLATPDVTVAQAIARRIREERERRSYLTGVRALGFLLASRNVAQVSLNLTQPEFSPLPEVFRFVVQEAAERGVSEVESEIIGAIPRSALAGLAPEAILWHTYRPTQILETWLEAETILPAPPFFPDSATRADAPEATTSDTRIAAP